MGRICRHPVLLVLALISWHVENVEMRALQSGISRTSEKPGRGGTSSLKLNLVHQLNPDLQKSKLSTQELPASLKSSIKQMSHTNLRNSYEGMGSKHNDQESENSTSSVDGLQKALKASHKAALTTSHAGNYHPSRAVVDRNMKAELFAREENNDRLLRNRRSSQMNISRHQKTNMKGGIKAKSNTYTGRDNENDTFLGGQQHKVETFSESWPEELYDSFNGFPQEEFFNVVRRKSADVSRRPTIIIRGRMDPAMRYMGIGK